jgi:hypothetical protein
MGGHSRERAECEYELVGDWDSCLPDGLVYRTYR